LRFFQPVLQRFSGLRIDRGERFKRLLCGLLRSLQAFQIILGFPQPRFRVLYGLFTREDRSCNVARIAS
jgi:hypothetical protein